MLACGLLGEKLGHSYSPQIHHLLGEYEYTLYEKQPEELEVFLTEGSWTGLNVTIPYKKTVLPYCRELSEVARKTGSVNTLVKREDGSIYGDNTDAFGFAAMLRHFQVNPAGKQTLILGNGGACASVNYVLNKAGARVTIISRSGEDHYGNLERHEDAELIINTTPVGMYPRTGEAPLDLQRFPRLEAVLDIVYNPARTALLLEGEARGLITGNGLYMLVAQAKRSSELFTGRAIDDGQIDRVEEILSHEMRNIVLIGMPGSGKSSIARALSKRIGRQLVDLDQEFEVRFGMSAENCIRTYGEEAFRGRETELIRDYGKGSGLILSTGGGCVTRAENYPLLHQNGIIVWIRRPLEELPVDGRPLSQQGSLAALYERRKGQYERFADRVVENTSTIDEAAAQICALCL